MELKSVATDLKTQTWEYDEQKAQANFTRIIETRKQQTEQIKKA